MIQIESVDIFPIPLTLREPYSIAYHTVDSVTNVGIKLYMSDGLIGVGASGPEEEVTHETFHTVLTAGATISSLLTGASFDTVEQAIETTAKALGNQPAALAMVDMALFDYAAKRESIPLFRYLQATRDSLPSTITVNLFSPEETLVRAKGWLAHGFSMLKIKGGLSFQDDVEKLELLRRDLSPSIPILFDLNQGYSVEQTLEFTQRVKDLNITCIEQPIDKSYIDGLCLLAAKSPIPIMADESLTDLKTAEKLAAGGVKFFNLKLMKSGGIVETRKYCAIAERHSVKVIVSCMDECALVNAAGLHFALSEPSVSFVDLDSYTDYTVDPTRAAVTFKDGKLIAQELPGLGFNF